MLLFADADAKKRAGREKGPARYRHGLAIVENKAWALPLDRGPPDLFNRNAPSSQMLRYLTRVEIESNGAIQWGILTNGKTWRLFSHRAASRSAPSPKTAVATSRSISSSEIGNARQQLPASMATKDRVTRGEFMAVCGKKAS